MCYKLNQDLETWLGLQSPIDKGKKKSHSQDAEVGTHWVDGGWQEAKTKKTYKPSGHLSSLGTKMFQSQNISLVEFQGLREKKN